MLTFKKYIQRHLLLFCILVLVTTVVFFPVSAASVPEIEFFDFDDYANYSYNTSTGLITADIQLPTSWRWSYAIDDDWITQWSNSFDFSTVDMYSPVIIDYNPFARVSCDLLIHHAPTQLGHYLDLQYIPSGAKLNVEFITQMDISNSLSSFADIFVGYVDSTGKVISHLIVPTTLNVIDLGNNRYHYVVLGTYTFNSIPDNATGCFYLVHTNNIFSGGEQEIPIVNVKSSLVFTYSEQNYNIKQNQIIRDKVSNIDKQLGELPDRIGDEVKDVIEQEKDESKEEGNKFVDQILDALPDPSQDVLAALKGLTDATAYFGTDAVLPIPAIVLPGINGLFPETEIWGGTEFDFGEYIGMLPSNLLTLVQSLFTIAIVLFCVYELKGIISYCLTLRESKGG